MAYNRLLPEKKWKSIDKKIAYTANVYTQMIDKLLFLYAINTHENV